MHGRQECNVQFVYSGGISSVATANTFSSLQSEFYQKKNNRKRERLYDVGWRIVTQTRVAICSDELHTMLKPNPVLLNHNKWPNIYMQSWTNATESTIFRCAIFLWIFREQNQKKGHNYKRRKFLLWMLVCILTKVLSLSAIGIFCIVTSHSWNALLFVRPKCTMNRDFTSTTEILSLNSNL